MSYTKQKHKVEPTGFKITNLTYINNIYPKIDDKKIKSRAATLIEFCDLINFESGLSNLHISRV